MNTPKLTHLIDTSLVPPARRERTISDMMKHWNVDKDTALALLDSGLKLSYDIPIEEQVSFEVAEDDAPEVDDCYLFSGPDDEAPGHLCYWAICDEDEADELLNTDGYELVYTGTEEACAQYAKDNPLEPTLGGVPTESVSHGSMKQDENSVCNWGDGHPTKRQLLDAIKAFNYDQAFCVAALAALEGECVQHVGEGSNLWKLTWK